MFPSLCGRFGSILAQGGDSLGGGRQLCGPALGRREDSLRKRCSVSTPDYHGVSPCRRRAPSSPGEQNAVADRLVVRGAREHNLKDVSLDLPTASLLVFTSLSRSRTPTLPLYPPSPAA